MKPVTKQNVTSFIVGFLFSIGLAVSGMTQPQRILHFLNPFIWDPSLLFVMVGAVGVHMITYPLIRKRSSPIFDAKWYVPTRSDITTRLILGSAIFGIGWGLGGYCPGPSLASLGSNDMRPFIFVITMILGIIIFKKTESRLNLKE